jgi:hypothetical protein
MVSPSTEERVMTVDINDVIEMLCVFGSMAIVYVVLQILFG